MADYVLEEIPVEGENPKRDKMFRTPNNNTYRVRVDAAQGGAITISVLDEDEQTLQASTLGFEGVDDPKAAVERQIADLVRAAERVQGARIEAYKYLQHVWGIELQSDPNRVYSVNPVGKVKFLNKGDDSQGE